MLDAQLLRNDSIVEKIRLSEKKRYRDPSNVDLCRELFLKSKKIEDDLVAINMIRNKVNLKMKQIFDKSKQQCNGVDLKSKLSESFITKISEMDPQEILNNCLDVIHNKIEQEKSKQIELDSLLACLNVENLKKLNAEISDQRKIKKMNLDQSIENFNLKWNEIGNILDERVFVSDDEVNNPIISKHGDLCLNLPFTHIDICELIDGIDTLRGTKVMGSRGYFLKGALVSLSQALQIYGVHFLTKKGYMPIQTPYMMKKKAMAAVAQQSQFDEELYKVSGKWMSENESLDTDNESKYLIATSEQPLAAMYTDEFLQLEDGPLRYAGISTCFRQEAGSHGKDTRGIFRVHQFEKIEQFIYCSPSDSSSEFDKLIATTTEFYNSLDIPFRIVSIVSKELNNAAALKYDFEGYFPGSQTFKELVSCSNCTDYQSRGANIRYGVSGSAKAPFVHMLNSTLCAITRTLCILMEINQTDDGIKVPPVLSSFMPPRYKDLIPYVVSPSRLNCMDN